jgi:hypothetical protein
MDSSLISEACFHGDERILMADGSEKAMKYVHIGDRVMGVNAKNGELIDDVITMIMHREPNMYLRSVFLVIACLLLHIE